MSLILQGSTSGSVTLQEPAVAGTTVLTLPATSGTVLTSASSVTSSQLPVGSVLQAVNVQSGTVTTTSSNIPNDNTIPQNTEGAELFTVSITPTKTSSKLLIQVCIQISPNSAAWTTVALFQDSGVDAIATGYSYMATATGAMVISFNHYMTAGTIASTTFKVRYGSSIGTTTVNGSSSGQYYGGTMSSSMTITEINA